MNSQPKRHLKGNSRGKRTIGILLFGSVDGVGDGDGGSVVLVFVLVSWFLG